jgi:hypothetical protein
MFFGGGQDAITNGGKSSADLFRHVCECLFRRYFNLWYQALKYQLIIRENVFYLLTGRIKHIDNALPSPASYHQIFFFKKRITGEG